MTRPLIAVSLLLGVIAGSAQTSPPVTLVVTAPVPLAPLRITFPPDGLTSYKVGDLLTLRAVAPAGSGVGEFFVNGIRLGESTGPDYRLTVRIGTEGIKRFTFGLKVAGVPATAARANSYDDAWHAAWVGKATATLRAGATLGKILHIGDSLTATQAYGDWCGRLGADRSDLDALTCAWMHAKSGGDDNGFLLAGQSIVTARAGMGWGDPLIALLLTNPRTKDAQFAIFLMNSTDIATVEATLQAYLAAGIVPILSTVPPRNVAGYDASFTLPFNAQLRALAQRLGLPLIDLWAEIAASYPGTSWNGPIVGPDGIHLTLAGYDLRTKLAVWKASELRANVTFPPPVVVPPPDGTLSSLPLVTKDTLIWQGAFGFPSYGSNGPQPGYGNGGLAYKPGATAAEDSLFVQLFVASDTADPNTKMAYAREMSIPPGVSKTDAFANVGQWLQPPGDVYGGQMAGLWNQSGDLLVYGNRLIATGFVYYDGGYTATKSHVAGSLVIGQGVGAPVLVDPIGLPPGGWTHPAVKAGWTGGWMGQIPPAWQAALGGPAFTGQCCLSIIGRTSSGPAFAVFDPAAIGTTTDPVPARLLLGYPDDFYDDHVTGLGQFATERWYGDIQGGAASRQSYMWGSDYFNGSTRIGGAVFVPGTRSILFFGKQGTGSFCYGDANPDPALFHTLVEPFLDGTTWRGGQYVCRTGPHEGHHTWADPYRYQVWAYDALDLVQVKAGTKQPWEVLPYAIWPLAIPLAPPAALDQGFGFRGATVNTRTGDIYVWQLNGSTPFLNVFHVP